MLIEKGGIKLNKITPQYVERAMTYLSGASRRETEIISQALRMEMVLINLQEAQCPI